MSIPEVATVDIMFSTKIATITTKPGKAISRDAVAAALEGAGYGVTSFTAASAAPNSGT